MTMSQKDFTRVEAYALPPPEPEQEFLHSVIKGTARGKGLQRALLPYQQRAVKLLESGCKVMLIEKSRRIGMTWGLAAEAVLRASRPKKSGGMNWLYISYSQDMTREFIDACAMWARLFDIAADDVGEGLFEDKKKGEETRSIKAYRITLSSGFYITGLSSAPRALRGKQGVVMIDEAAFVDSLPELLKSALALRMWGGQIIICSTHLGDANPFNQLIKDVQLGKKKYELLRVDFDDALRDGLYKRICQVNGEEWTAEKEAAWRDEIISDYPDSADADEELFCIPGQGSGTWLATALIERQMQVTDSPLLQWTWPKDYLQWGDAAQRKHLEERKREIDIAAATLDPQCRHVMGFDFGRVVDLSVAEILSIDHMTKRRTAITIEMRNAPFDEQRELMQHLFPQLPRAVGAAFDARGSGHYIAEGMARKFGVYDQVKKEGGQIASIQLSTTWYAENMPKLRGAFDEGNILIRKSDDHLSDLRIVKVVRGIATIPDVRTGTKGMKRHGDYAVALAMGWYASEMNTSEIAYEAAGGRHQSREDQFMYAREDFGDDGEEWRQPLGADIRGSI